MAFHIVYSVFPMTTTINTSQWLRGQFMSRMSKLGNINIQLEENRIEK